MPLTDKGAEIKAAMEDQYGKEKGESVFYASKNKGTITGVDSARPLYGAKRGRDIFFGAKDQQPSLVTTPNAGVPGFATQLDDTDDDC
jgi:hypothetical protein